MTSSILHLIAPLSRRDIHECGKYTNNKTINNHFNHKIDIMLPSIKKNMIKNMNWFLRLLDFFNLNPYGTKIDAALNMVGTQIKNSSTAITFQEDPLGIMSQVASNIYSDPLLPTELKQNALKLIFCIIYTLQLDSESHKIRHSNESCSTEILDRSTSGNNIKDISNLLNDTIDENNSSKNNDLSTKDNSSDGAEEFNDARLFNSSYFSIGQNDKTIDELDNDLVIPTLRRIYATIIINIVKNETSGFINIIIKIEDAIKYLTSILPADNEYTERLNTILEGTLPNIKRNTGAQIKLFTKNLSESVLKNYEGDIFDGKKPNLDDPIYNSNIICSMIYPTEESSNQIVVKNKNNDTAEIQLPISNRDNANGEFRGRIFLDAFKYFLKEYEQGQYNIDNFPISAVKAFLTLPTKELLLIIQKNDMDSYEKLILSMIIVILNSFCIEGLNPIIKGEVGNAILTHPLYNNMKQSNVNELSKLLQQV